jgi:Rrf2 family protein
VNITDIAKEIDSPMAFTAKILQKLVKGGVLQSVKGPHGGFEIAKETTKETTLADVIKAMDCTSIYTGCSLGLKECSDLKPCPLHNSFKKIRTDLRTMMEATTLKSLALQLEDGHAFLK